MEWSAETVEGLAPDAASVTAARKLARPGPWSGTGLRRARGLGAVQGQRLAALPGAGGPLRPGLQVLCPSRKFPCKHALALLLLRARMGAFWRAAGVGVRWLASRLSAAARAARGRRRARRRATGGGGTAGGGARARIAGGVEDLQRWLRDAVRGGLGAGRLRSGTSGTRSRRAWWTPRRRAPLPARARWSESRRGGPTVGRSGCSLASACCTCCARPICVLRGRSAMTCARRSVNVAREEVLAGARVADRWAVLARP